MARKSRARRVSGYNEKYLAQRHGSGGRAMRAGASRIEKAAETRARRDGAQEIVEGLSAMEASREELLQEEQAELAADQDLRNKIGALWAEVDCLPLGSKRREELLDRICEMN